MEVIRGESELLLTVREEAGGMVIVQAMAAGDAAIIPESIRGVPVTALAHHAFAPGRGEAEGERIRIACGPAPSEVPDNGGLRAVTLPPTLRRVGDYAFYNCTALEQVRLHASVEEWGGGVFMNCRRLDTMVLHVTGSRVRPLSYLADELSRELDVTIVDQDGEGRFIFPEFREDLDENCPNHYFDYHITGGGYPYHHCFRDNTFAAGDFDRLWDKYLQTRHDPGTALRLAWHRLRRPRQLAPEAEEKYLAYLRSHGEDAMAWLMEERDGEGLAWLLETCGLRREVISAGCERARQTENHEAQALLLEQLRRTEPAGRRKSFDL